MKEEKFTFFYTGSPFSNFFKAYFIDDKEIKYSCTEQYFMAQKALFFKDEGTYHKIMKEYKPGKMKSLGREVKGFTEEEWYGGDNPAKLAMYQGNYYKYSQNEDLKKILFETKGTTLVETSPRDDIWGIGMIECPEAYDRSLWQGTNWLGEILTNLRETLMEEDKKKNFLF